MASPSAGMPPAWSVAAPRWLPRPIAAILARPLSTGPWKSVCGFTRLTSSTPSAFAAIASWCTGVPSARRPSTTVSIVASTGHPIDSAVTPSPASISRCPSAVAPPCDPIAGTTKGSAPTSFSQSTAARTTVVRSRIPRLPTVTAILAPGNSRSRNGSSAACAAAAGSTSVGQSVIVWRTGVTSGMLPSGRNPRIASNGPQPRISDSLMTLPAHA